MYLKYNHEYCVKDETHAPPYIIDIIIIISQSGSLYSKQTAHYFCSATCVPAMFSKASDG